MANLGLTHEDARLMLAADVHVGERNLHYQMKPYIHGRDKDGNNIFNIRTTYDKIVLAARAICAISTQSDVAIVGTHNHTQRAVLKCARYTGAFPFAGRYTPGTFTNQIQRAFREPRLLVCHDPKNDHQAIAEASYVNIPVISFCDADSSPRLVDIVIPCNTKGANSIGLMFWMLSREVLRMRGKISRDMPWDVMVDLFFYRTQEDQEKQETVTQQSAAIPGAGVLASMTANNAATQPMMVEEDWNNAGWDADPTAAGAQLAPGAAAARAPAAAQQFGAVGGPAPTLQPGADWSAVGQEDWTGVDSWQ